MFLSKPYSLPETTSSTISITVLAVSYTHLDVYKRQHPGGALGRKLLTLVSDVMRAGDDVPVVKADTLLYDALFEITKKGIAMTAVVDEAGHAIGVFTDGDLRRLIEKQQHFSNLVIRDVMSKNPRTISSDKLAAEAVSIMEKFRINQLLVTDNDGKMCIRDRLCCGRCCWVFCAGRDGG